MKRLFWLLYYGIFATAGVFAGSALFNSCEKSHAAPRPAQVFALSDGCADSAGTYMPALIASLNVNNVTFRQSHFIRVCNEVTVQGRLSWSSATTAGGAATVVFAVPIATTIDRANTYGLYNFTQSGVGVVPFTGQLVTDPFGNIQISFTPTKTSNGSMFYTFTYTIQ